MLRQSRTSRVGLVVLAILVACNSSERILAQKASIPRQQDKIALGEEEVKRLLLLMDTDKDGKVSRQEFMAYMEEQFKRLDKKNEGKVDVKEVTKVTPRTSPSSSVQSK